MKKYIALIAVVLLASFAMSGIALAKADVQTLVPYAYPGEPPDAPDASGKAVVNQPNGDVCLQVTVSAKGLTPGTYDIYGATSSLKGDFMWIGQFTTNKNGNGHFHRNYLQTETLPPTTSIMINNAENRTVLIDKDWV